MRLWDKGGELDAAVAEFTVGDDPTVDLAWAAHDVIGSAAHVSVLEAAGQLTYPEAAKLRFGLNLVLDDIRCGRFTIGRDEEDVHTAIEARLTARLGPVAGKIHTGRSRNDQVLTALRLWMLDELDGIEAEWHALAQAWLSFGAAHRDVPLTGYTHLQPAMPSSYGLWSAGYAAALLDLLPLLDAARAVVDRCPLGSAAGYGTPLPLDRALGARLLGFSAVEAPVTTPQLTRGLVESALLGALGAATALIARWSWDLVIFTSAEFALIRLPDAFTTGSSIMPQKRNPDVAELLRATAVGVRAARREIEDLVALPGGYQRDVQLTKAPLLRGVRASRQALRIAAHLAPALTPTPRPLDPTLFAAAEAYRRDKPFREAYGDVAAELKAGTFAAQPSPPPAWDVEVLHARVAAPTRDRWAAWNALVAPV
ncbi:argininosuccinate lyase [Deltaproteobacteria bacterium]|nr:argininosuccinate lyase [Deltaproteobacteria bacterium]